ncbi:MAG: TonB-dependent receptor [Solimonas sp.]
MSSSKDFPTSVQDKRPRSVEAHAVKMLVGTIAAMVAYSAQAQEAPAETPAAVASADPAAAPDAGEASSTEEVVITGTSIKRKDDAALPVTVMSAEAMDLRDAGTPVDLLTALPAVTGVPINESTQGGAGARGDVAGIALRGLGASATLLLLNGRRMAAYGIASGTDMTVNANMMPVRGLSRVDVLRDGASSIYGSDAVAGVVNFVIDSKFRGDQAEFQAGFTEVGSGSDRRLTLTHGDFYLGGKLHWISTLDAYQRDALETRDVAGDSDKTSKVPYGFNSSSGAFFDRSASSQYPIFTVTDVGKRYLVPNGNGTAIISSTAPDTTGQYSRNAYYDVNAGYTLPETVRFNWFNQLDYQLTDNVALFGEALLYSAQSKMQRPPVAYSSSTDEAIVLAADNPFNPYGTTVTINNYRFVDDGNERIEDDTLAYRFVFGGRGSFADHWNWESAATYSRSGTHDISENAIRESAMQAAVADGLYNPFGYNFSTVDGEVTPTTKYVNDPAVIGAFAQRFHQNGRDILATVDGRVTGELIDLWAGPLQVAAGGEYRHEDYALYRPQYVGLNYEDNALGLDSDDNDFVQASPAANLAGTRGVWAAFAETVVPLASPSNGIIGVHSLSLGASVRYEHYSDFGSTTNPKFTLDYRPVEPVMIRASYNEGFRAPNLAMMNYERTATSSYSDPYTALVGGGASTPRLVTTSALGDLGPETSKGVTFGVVIDVPKVEGLRFSVDYFRIKMDDVISTPSLSQLLNDDATRLKAATQTALAAGTALEDIDLGSGTSDYKGNPYVVRSTVTDENRELFDTYNAAQTSSSDYLAVVGDLTETKTPFTNADKQVVSGYDFNVTYNLPRFSWGKVAVSTDWTYLDDFRQTGGLTGVSSVLLGADGNTRLRGSADLNWSYDLWAAGLSAYYIGDYADTSAVFTPDSDWTGKLPGYVKTVDGIHYWKVDATVTLNAFVSRSFVSDSKWLDGMTVRLGVKNLTDKAPPLNSDPAGYDQSVYNSIAAGRTWTLRFSKNF